MFWLVLVFNEYEIFIALAAQCLVWMYRLPFDLVATSDKKSSHTSQTRASDAQQAQNSRHGTNTTLLHILIFPR